MSGSEPPQPATPPAFSVVRGSPTDEELVAVLAVLSAHRPADPGTAPVAGSGWSAYWRVLGAPLRPGPGAWQASSRP